MTLSGGAGLERLGRVRGYPFRLPLIGTAPHPIAHALHPEGISNDEYDGRISELTPPSFC